MLSLITRNGWERKDNLCQSPQREGFHFFKGILLYFLIGLDASVGNLIEIECKSADILGHLEKIKIIADCICHMLEIRSAIWMKNPIFASICPYVVECQGVIWVFRDLCLANQVKEILFCEILHYLIEVPHTVQLRQHDLDFWLVQTHFCIVFSSSLTRSIIVLRLSTLLWDFTSHDSFVSDHHLSTRIYFEWGIALQIFLHTLYFIWKALVSWEEETCHARLIEDNSDKRTS